MLKNIFFLKKMQFKCKFLKTFGTNIRFVCYFVEERLLEI